MKNKEFQIEKVFWEKGRFKPWYVSENFESRPISSLVYQMDREILIVENDTFTLGFLKSDIIYHHVVQGTHLGKSYMVSYCAMCNAGVVMEPIIDGEYVLFESVGIYEGQLLNWDVKTKSLWNHLLGECIHGELKGKQLVVSSLIETTVEAALSRNPNLAVLVSRQQRIAKKAINVGIRLLDRLSQRFPNLLPGFFVKTIIEEDTTLPRMTKGLVVRIQDTIKFYPAETIVANMGDSLNGTEIRIFRGHVPYAEKIDGKRPFQLFMRWYAFRINYPEGELFQVKSKTHNFGRREK